MPDVLFRNGNDIYIVEHKHVNEGGGGQNKQISELISFIHYEEGSSTANVHYIAFLDGRYFNTMSDNRHVRTGKIASQIANVENGLKVNKNNYFVNTAGFDLLLRSLK